MTTRTDSISELTQHVAGAIMSASEREEPFYHLQLRGIFPSAVYEEMLRAMPVKSDYRTMSGRTKDTRTDDGGTRTKIDLFPEYLRRLPSEKKKIWNEVGQALRSAEVRHAFMQRLAPGLNHRFGSGHANVGMYPIPVLTRDVPGYSIPIHPDTHWKGMTIQLYLPQDLSIEHVGTVFHKRKETKGYTRALQMPFAPNSGYAFAVDKHTFHSVDLVGPEVSTRDSILLTYFVDKSPLQMFRNRSRRFGNFLLQEWRGLLGHS